MPVKPDPHEYFRKSTSRRVVDQTRDRERARRGGDGIPDRPTAPRIVGVGILMGKLPGTAIASHGTGTVTRQKWSGTAYVNDTITDTVYNPTAGATTTATICFYYNDGNNYVLMGWEC